MWDALGVLAMLDADGTYVPSYLPEILSYFPDYDQVNGARTSEQGTLPWLRRPAKWLIRRLAQYLMEQPIPDLNSGLRAFRRDVALQYINQLPAGFSCVTTITIASGFSAAIVFFRVATSSGAAESILLMTTTSAILRFVSPGW